MKQQPMKRVISRTIIYVVILASTFCTLRFIFDFFNLHYTDINNARYILSAMAQSQAAIIAIVITVSLVAVQLGASTYSPRAVNIFKSNPDLWLLLALYGGSISYDFIILKMLGEKINEFYIFISYWLCASAFLALFPYVLSMMNILNPRAIIGRLLENIDIPDTRISFESDEVGYRKREDPFQPVVDIIRGAFMKYDYETVKMGLRMMTAKVIKVINSCNTRKYMFIPGVQNPINPFKDFSKHYSNHSSQIGKLFAERDEELTLETIENLKRVAEAITEKRLGTEEYVAEALGNIGKISTQKEFQKATEEVTDTIGEMIESIPCEDYTIIWPNGHKYRYPYGNVIRRVVYVLDDIGIAAVKKWGMFYALQFVGRNLEKVGVSITKKGSENEWEVIDTARIFNAIGIIALDVEKTSSEIRDFILYDKVIRPLSIIGKIAHEKGMMPQEKAGASGFGRIVYALWDVGINAAVVGFNETASRAAKALAELTILDKEVVREEMSNLKHKEARIESLEEFQKFIKIYNRYLKRLRVSKDGSQNEEQT